MGTLDRRVGVTYVILLWILVVGCAGFVSPGQPTPASGPADQPPGQGAEQCPPEELSSLGVLRSYDRGVTWETLGNVCLHGRGMKAVDPTGFWLDDRIVLYFFDFDHLNQPVPQSVYHATSMDGVNFDTPKPVYTQDQTMVDGFVLPLLDGSYRLYVPSADEGIISATSRDGLYFTREQGLDLGYGGMPGALLLPDGKVRMFLNGQKDGGQGIFSKISQDGLNFQDEPGLRIRGSRPDLSVIDPQPIRLRDGSYLMSYLSFESKNMDQPDPWTFTELRYATSKDGFIWEVNPVIVGHAGTSCMVEMPDGALLAFFVNA